MSNIPAARKILEHVLEAHKEELGPHTVSDLHRALGFMKRRSPVHRGIGTPYTLDETVKRNILNTAAANPDFTLVEIATAVGLPAHTSGRVSEVLHGLR